MSDGAKKFDTGKTQWTCLPLLAVEEMARVMTHGAQKYGARNFLEGGGLAFSRLSDAMLRHFTAFWKRDEIDGESGLNHLAHAMCCLGMMLEYIKRGKGIDDRP